MSCDVCDKTGVGPDGSYCRVEGCFYAEWRRWKDHAIEVSGINIAIQCERLADLEQYQKLQRAYHKLQYDFQTYGRHHRSCKGSPCTCGFDKVQLKGVRL